MRYQSFLVGPRRLYRITFLAAKRKPLNCVTMISNRLASVLDVCYVKPSASVLGASAAAAGSLP